MWKDRVRPFLHPLPQWSTVAIAPPQQAVTATLRWGCRSKDVTADHTVASLKPLTIASSIDAGPRAVLEYHDRDAGTLLGELQLTRMAPATACSTAPILYHVAAGAHHCLGWPRRPWNAWLQNRAMRRNRTPRAPVMEPAEVQQLMVAYLCPRPVVLASVAAPGHRNMFPMDLIGPLERSGLFSLALRTTNVSVPILGDVRRIVLSGIPAGMKAAVYRLAAQHRQPLADWDSLPFPVRPSRTFGIPAVAAALTVRELAIVHSQPLGSHVFFLARVVSDDASARGDQLHHTPGFHQAYWQRRRMPFATA